MTPGDGWSGAVNIIAPGRTAPFPNNGVAALTHPMPGASNSIDSATVRIREMGACGRKDENKYSNVVPFRVAIYV